MSNMCRIFASHHAARPLRRRWAASHARKSRTPAWPTRPHLPRRMGTSKSQASRGWRPSFLFSPSHLRSVRVDRLGRNASGSHAVRWSLTVLLFRPSKRRSNASMAGGVLASASQAHCPSVHHQPCGKQIIQRHTRSIKERHAKAVWPRCWRQKPPEVPRGYPLTRGS